MKVKKGLSDAVLEYLDREEDTQKELDKIRSSFNSEYERAMEKLYDRESRFINISDGYPINTSFNQKGLLKYIMLPDYSPLRGTPGVGTVTIFDASEHTFIPEYLGNDAGCGMLLGKFEKRSDFLEDLIEKLYNGENKNSIARELVGGGNHFINIYESIFSPEDVYVVVHTNEQQRKDEVNYSLDQALQIGKSKRASVLENLCKFFGTKIEPLEDRAHNTFEVVDNKAIYRKGAVKISSGERGFITSSFNGDAIIFRATPDILELENSICHGTGRVMPRSQCEDEREAFRGLWKVKELISPYVEIDDHLRPLGVEEDYIYEIKRNIREEHESLDCEEIRKKAQEFCVGQKEYFGNKDIDLIGIAEDKFIMSVALSNAKKTIEYLTRNDPGIKRRSLDRKDRFIELENALRKEAILSRVLGI